MSNERILPRGVLSAGITVKIDWDKPGDQWHATARANVAPLLADAYTTYGNADDPVTAAWMAVAALVKRSREAGEAARLDRVPVNEDTVDRIATAVADRVAEKLSLATAVPAREAVEPKPRPKNGRRRRRARPGVTKVIGRNGRRGNP